MSSNTATSPLSDAATEIVGGPCTAFPLDGVCFATNPCALHECSDTDDGRTSQGCYCDPERCPASPEEADRG